MKYCKIIENFNIELRDKCSEDEKEIKKELFRFIKEKLHFDKYYELKYVS